MLAQAANIAGIATVLFNVVTLMLILTLSDLVALINFEMSR